MLNDEWQLVDDIAVRNLPASPVGTPAAPVRPLIIQPPAILNQYQAQQAVIAPPQPQPAIVQPVVVALVNPPVVAVAQAPAPRPPVILPQPSPKPAVAAPIAQPAPAAPVAAPSPVIDQRRLEAAIMMRAGFR
jgi:fused signal recognition particle receptor